jgi:short-subunit dehydrogenase
MSLPSLIFLYFLLPLIPLFIFPFLLLSSLLSAITTLLKSTTYFINKFNNTNTNLNQYKLPSNNNWAIITGASSGIGEQYAYQLAQEQFHLILSARRKDRLQELANELQEKYKIKVHVITADFSKTNEIHQQYIEEIIQITNGNIAIFCHLAGNSDLAKHFTDKSIERNIELLRLNVESTLILTQRFTEIMMKRYFTNNNKHHHVKSAIITCGALTSYIPAPGFACSSGNKHYIMGLTQALAMEYEHYIDFLIVHPIAIRSEILSNSGTNPLVDTFVLDSSVFVRNTLQDLLVVTNSPISNGSIVHDIIVWILYQQLPVRFVQRYFFQYNIERFGQFLNRIVDGRELREKFGGKE